MTLVEELNNIMGQENVYEKEPMKNHTTFRIGGPADILVCPETDSSLIEGIQLCRSRKVPATEAIFLSVTKDSEGLFLKYVKI